MLFHTLKPEFNTNRNTANMNLEKYQCLCRQFSCWLFRTSNSRSINQIWIYFFFRNLNFNILCLIKFKYSYWSMECCCFWHNRTLSLHNIFQMCTHYTLVSHIHIVKYVTEFFLFDGNENTLQYVWHSKQTEWKHMISNGIVCVCVHMNGNVIVVDDRTQIKHLSTEAWSVCLYSKFVWCCIIDSKWWPVIETFHELIIIIEAELIVAWNDTKPLENLAIDTVTTESELIFKKRALIHHKSNLSTQNVIAFVLYELRHK